MPAVISVRSPYDPYGDMARASEPILPPLTASPGAHDVVRAKRLAPPAASPQSAGTSPGINIAPGSDDDGWIVPHPVHLADGTRVQLFKDGEALRAAYEAIRHAKKRVCLKVYIFADNDTGRAYAELLCAKAMSGVKVYLIYDSFGSFSISQLWRPKPAIFEK